MYFTMTMLHWLGFCQLAELEPSDKGNLNRENDPIRLGKSVKHFLD